MKTNEKSSVDFTKPIRFIYMGTIQEVKFIGKAPDGRIVVSYRYSDNNTWHIICYSTIGDGWGSLKGIENIPEPKPRVKGWVNVYKGYPSGLTFLGELYTSHKVVKDISRGITSHLGTIYIDQEIETLP